MTTASTTPMSTPATYLTTRQVAERLQVSPNTVCRLAREGRIPSHRVGHRTLRFVAAEVDAALRRGSQPEEPDGSLADDLDERVARVVEDVIKPPRPRARPRKGG